MVVSVTERCVCGCRDARKRTHHKLRVLECSFCGMQRQIVSDTVDDYVSWYRGTYHSDIYTHTTTQDEDTARKRIKCYDIRPQGRLLDIGCGNGAFVNVALRQGIESYGIDVADVAQDKTRIYVGELESVSFPTCEFDCVTMHDVLEHFPDPLSSLREVMRIVKEEGQLILEVPDFHCSSGKRHWKEREHIWFLRRKDVERMLDQAGFDLQSVTKPVSGKLVFYATKPKQERLNILVPPGIGDIYWVMVKLQSFLRERQITVPPNVHIVSLDSAKDRSADYVRMVPFVRGAGYKQCNRHSSLWKEAYMQDGTPTQAIMQALMAGYGPNLRDEWLKHKQKTAEYKEREFQNQVNPNGGRGNARALLNQARSGVAGNNNGAAKVLDNLLEQHGTYRNSRDAAKAAGEALRAAGINLGGRR